MSSMKSTSFDVIARVWGDSEGYVWTPWIEAGSWGGPKGPRYHEGRAWRWPEQSEEIKAHIESHSEDDQYFTPGVFSAPRRVAQHATPVPRLWADLDPVDPRAADGLTPTIAWETSPGRYQCVWEMPYPREGATEHGGPNHRLTHYLGADPSGWDATQLLRIPGAAHTKHGQQRGEILWTDGPQMSWRKLADLPEVPTRDEDAAMQALSEDAVRGVDRAAVWGRVRPLVSSHTRELMALRDAGGIDRSGALWSVERDLADAGCSVLEIVALVMGTALDKYRGRGDHLRRLSIEAARAVSDRPAESLEGGALPEGAPMWASDLASTHVPRPRWLIDGVWTRGGCGFVSGAPKSYKSWMSLEMAVSIATGRQMLGTYRVVSPGPVLYLQEEDSLATVVDRLDAIVEGRSPQSHWGGVLEVGSGKVTWGPPSSLPIDIQAHTGVVLSDPRWMAWLSERVRTYEYRAVVIDTLTTTVGDVDLDKAVDLQTRVLRPLREMAQTYDCAVIVVHHSRKNTQQGRRGSNMLGSVALHGWVDCALYLDRDEESGVITVSPEGKHDPVEGWSMRVPRIHRDWVSGIRTAWAPEIVSGGTAAPDKPIRVAGSKIADIIRGMGGSATASELRSVVGRGFSRQISSALSSRLIDEAAPGVFALVTSK